MARRCLGPAAGRPVHGRRGPARDAGGARGDFAAAKRRLLLAPHRGSFLGHCPAGTRGLACCNYLVMNLAANCPMDCGYCFLQEYLADNRPLTAYVNPEAALAELAHCSTATPTGAFASAPASSPTASRSIR